MITATCQSIMFNFCEKIKLELLAPKASQDLIIIPMESIDVQFKNEKVIVDNIISITARHPNMIQYICDKLIKEINKLRKINREMKGGDNDKNKFMI